MKYNFIMSAIMSLHTSMLLRYKTFFDIKRSMLLRMREDEFLNFLTSSRTISRPDPGYILNPFSPTCATFLVKLCNLISRQAIDLERCSNPLRIQQVL